MLLALGALRARDTVIANAARNIFDLKRFALAVEASEVYR